MAVYKIQGDLLASDCTAIGHQANCKNVMGGGVALQIKNKYPEAYSADTQANMQGTNVLGNYSRAVTNDGKIVYNLYGQDGYGWGIGHTVEEKLGEAIEKMVVDLLPRYKEGTVKIGLPYNIGCLRGGGTWSDVFAEIKRVSEKYEVDIYLYEYEG